MNRSTAQAPLRDDVRRCGERRRLAGERAHWQDAASIIDRARPVLVDARQTPFAVNTLAAQVGIGPAQDIDRSCIRSPTARRRGTMKGHCAGNASTIVPWAGWLIELRSDESVQDAVLSGDSGSTTTHRLATNNLRLARGNQPAAPKLERQILAVRRTRSSASAWNCMNGLGQHLTGVSFVARTLADKLRNAEHPEAKEAEWLVSSQRSDHSYACARARPLAGQPRARHARQSIRKWPRTLIDLGVSCAVQGSTSRDCLPVCRASRVPHLQERRPTAIKHGRARRLTFRLELVGDEFTFCVINDGLPVDPEQLVAGKGLGVVGMRIARGRGRRPPVDRTAAKRAVRKSRSHCPVCEHA